MKVSHLSHYASAGFGHVMGARARRATSVSSFATLLRCTLTTGNISCKFCGDERSGFRFYFKVHLVRQHPREALSELNV